MNLKERGITVGDLLVTLILIISTVFIINKIKGNEKQSQLLKIPNQNSLVKTV
tara:strand:- start:199 stop:357 length:159 start_codon:yes stop_codon:yes gene_type:complete